MSADRVVPGIRGHVSELELDNSIQRKVEAHWSKARRGELALIPPAGFDIDDLGQWVITSDETVADAIRMVFAKFNEVGSARQVFVWWHEHTSGLTPPDIDAIAERVRRRVLRGFARSGLLDADDTCDRLGWDNSGFSLDASVHIAAHDRAGLERLLRYGARPPFALERLEQVEEERVIYWLPKPQREGHTALSLTPLELVDHLAALIPPPRLHRHRYHGVLAPNSPLRLAVTAYGKTLPRVTCRHRPRPLRHQLPLRLASAPQHATSGPCCSYGCSNPCRWSAPTAAPTCTSWPSSPSPPRSSGSSHSPCRWIFFILRLPFPARRPVIRMIKKTSVTTYPLNKVDPIVKTTKGRK